MPFSLANLGRLLKKGELDKLEIGVMHEELVLLPFTTKAVDLDYKINEYFKPRDFASLSIVTEDLNWKVIVDDNCEWYWDKLLISFLNRVAKLGHFEKLGLSVCYWDEDGGGDGFYKSTRIAVVADALDGAIRGNRKLSCLDLSDPDSIVNWVPHLEKIRKAVQEHGGLHSFLMKDGSSKNDDDSDEDDEGVVTIHSDDPDSFDDNDSDDGNDSESMMTRLFRLSKH